MSLMYDKNVFSTQLKNLRKSRWKQYKNNQDKRNNPYEKYAYCKSQDTLSEKLNVERRTYGKWENGMEMAGRNPVDESKSDRTPVNDKTETAAPSISSLRR